MVQNAKTFLRKTLIPAVLLAGITQVGASPITDDCTAGTGCIKVGDGKGEFTYFAKFYADTYTFEGTLTYKDANFNISTDKLIDYADPAGMGGYRILSFKLEDPNYPNHTEVRIVVDDFGDTADDTFEVQFHGGTYYAASGKLLAECSGGISISQDCNPTPPPSPEPPPSNDCDDRVTGGGWIIGPSGCKANFGVRGGIYNGSLWGGLKFLDHKTRMQVKSTAVTAYSHFSAVGREIRYNVNINGNPGTAIVRVEDNGEPGRNDTFSISLSNGYTASGDLGGAKPGGGNIQLHKAKCDKPGKDKGDKDKDKGDKDDDDDKSNENCPHKSKSKCKSKNECDDKKGNRRD